MCDKNKIYLDYDDVLADLIGPTLSWINTMIDEPVCHRSEIITYDYLIERYGNWVSQYWRMANTYFMDILPLDGAVQFVKDLKEKFGEDNIYIITRATENIHEEKAEHAEYHFDVKRGHVIFHWNKFEKTKDGILIDDYIENITGHVVHNLRPGILFNYKNRNPWAAVNMNSDLIIKSSSYEDTLRILEDIYEAPIGFTCRCPEL